MNAEIKKKWLEALRSGKYRQGKNRLCINDSYCCMGVLLEILKDDLGLQKKEKCENSDIIITYNGESQYLPDEVVKAAELPSHNPRVKFCYDYSLAHLNDVQRLSFNQIADIIEEQL